LETVTLVLFTILEVRYGLSIDSNINDLDGLNNRRRALSLRQQSTWFRTVYCRDV